MLPSKLRIICQELNKQTKETKIVNICGPYTGSQEILESFDDKINAPDSIFRSSGERRLSDFLTWQVSCIILMKFYRHAAVR